jgi:hypothetical protein
MDWDCGFENEGTIAIMEEQREIGNFSCVENENSNWVSSISKVHAPWKGRPVTLRHEREAQWDKFCFTLVLLTV